jgi:hypothetical protein
MQCTRLAARPLTFFTKNPHKIFPETARLAGGPAIGEATGLVGFNRGFFRRVPFENQDPLARPRPGCRRIDPKALRRFLARMAPADPAHAIEHCRQ